MAGSRAFPGEESQKLFQVPPSTARSPPPFLTGFQAQHSLPFPSKPQLTPRHPKLEMLLFLEDLPKVINFSSSFWPETKTKNSAFLLIGVCEHSKRTDVKALFRAALWCLLGTPLSFVA
ncbi:uncharacterized protein ACOB8E_007980 isoform 1-T2 [Sarcophilus harrisii]